MSDEKPNQDPDKQPKGRATMDAPQEEFITDQAVPSDDASAGAADRGHGHEVLPAKKENAEHGHKNSESK